MKFWKSLLVLSAFVGVKIASAVVVEFQGSGTYQVYTGTWPNYVIYNPTFTVNFSYDTAAAPSSLDAIQRSYAGLSFGLTINFHDGTQWSHTSQNVAISILNSTSDSFQITTLNPIEAGVPPFGMPSWGPTTYPVLIYTFEMTKYGGGVFADGDVNLPSSATFFNDLENWDVKHAKLYMGPNWMSGFNNPLSSVGAPTGAIPEPSTWAAIAGAGALGLALVRRRFVRM